VQPGAGHRAGQRAQLQEGPQRLAARPGCCLLVIQRRHRQRNATGNVSAARAGTWHLCAHPLTNVHNCMD